MHEFNTFRQHTDNKVIPFKYTKGLDYDLDQNLKAIITKSPFPYKDFSHITASKCTIILFDFIDDVLRSEMTENGIPLESVCKLLGKFSRTREFLADEFKLKRKYK